MSDCSFDLARLRGGIKPFRLHWFSRLRSTNDHAAALRKRGELFAPAMVLTGRQIAGRGRGSNQWWSGAGSITVTFAFAVDQHLAPYHVPLIAGLALRAAAAEVSGNDDVQLKWPNDLLYEEKKLAGLLCERAHNVDLVGVGLNVNPDLSQIPGPLRKTVTSLKSICGRELDMTAVLCSVTSHLHRRLSHRNEQSFAAVAREYDRHHALLGRRVMVQNGGDAPISGKCEGLDAMGRLLIRDRRTLVRVIAGSVRVI